jgi:hypothetical protein
MFIENVALHEALDAFAVKVHRMVCCILTVCPLEWGGVVVGFCYRFASSHVSFFTKKSE